MHIFSSYSLALLAATRLVSSTPTPRGNGLPVVDLEYTLQQASAINETGQYLNFSNIAYAQPPLGHLRFSPPQPPKSTAGLRNGGTFAPACPQAFPKWLSEDLGFGSYVPKGIGETEDCLYLDVQVPTEIFEGRNDRSSRGAPVLVWVHGGGFVVGSKTSNGSPAGLLARSMEETGSDGVVYVALNYRLGAIGWLAGDLFTSAGGSANLGLQDQRLALDWIQHNIHLFGGDTSRVTVMGESGGATSIGYQISTTAEGVTNIPFQQAIFQSTAEIPLLPNSALDANFESFLAVLGVNSLVEAKKVDTDLVQAANNATVYNSPTGRFPYGPSSDGSWVKGRVGQDLTAANFNCSLNVLTGYNRNEGTQFIQHNITNFNQYVASALPGASSDEIDLITSTLYPPPGPGTSYTSNQERAYLFTSELFVDCYADAINRAITGEAYTYRFSVAPAHHTTDLPYTFYSGPSPRVANETVARAMQTFFTNFAVHGNPHAGSARDFSALPQYGAGQMLDLTEEGFDAVEAPIANGRCAYWANPGSAV